jgi:ABC-type Zn uptake system ZnuABC Zn-binding protein ZnuA
MSRYLSLILAAALLIAVMPGTAAQESDPIRVVASFSILADVAANVAGDVAEVTSLVPLGAGPHGFNPSPQDMVKLSEADVVFVVGANFEEVLMETIANADQDMNIVIASNCVYIQPFGSDHEEHESGEDDHKEDEHHETCEAHHAEIADFAPPMPEDVHTLGMLHAVDCGGHHHDEEDHDDEDDDGGDHAHEVGSCDPHVWTDPYNAMLWALTIRDTLSALDPDNADVYAANAKAYIAEISDIFEDVEAMIATIPEDNRKLVTNHLAYGYYANRFGLEMAGTIIPAASTMAEPSARQIAELIDKIGAAGVPAVFADSTANPDLAQQVADETGVSFHRLYTGSLTGEDGPAPTYIDYILVDTEIIVSALGGTVKE